MSAYRLSTNEVGLRVATERLESVGTTTIAIAVGVGARYEQAGEEGLSHLLEHMAFKGTATRNAKEIAEAFDDMGAAFNAYTSLEHTVYYTRVLQEHTEAALELLADILQNPTFDEEELKREQQVIVQEIGMHQDSPEDLVFDHLFTLAYPEQALGRSILGTAEQVTGYGRNNVAAYMNQHYTNGGMVLSAAGAVDHAHMLELSARYFPNITQGSAPVCERATYVGGAQYTEADFEQLHLMLCVPGLDFHDKDHMAQQLFSMVLGGGGSSQLFQEVREKRGLAYSVYSFTSAFADTAMFGVYAATSAEKAGELLEVLAEQWYKVLEILDEKQLQRAKQQQKSALLMTRESSSALAEWMGRHLLDYGRYKPAEELAAEVDAVTLEDLKRVGEKIIRQTAFSLAAVGPLGTLPEPEKALDLLRKG